MCSNAIAPASITGDRKRDFTPISFSLFCLRKPLSQLQHVANVSLYGQSRTCNTWRIRHHKAESSKLQTEILTWRILHLSYLSACWHRRQKQNSHCFQCQKASWTTLKDFYLARWPDAIWKKMTPYFLALCRRDSWRNYLLPILNQPTALPRAVTQLLLSPQTPRADESRISGQRPHGSRGSGAGSEAAQPAAARSMHRRAALAICRGAEAGSRHGRWRTLQ